MTLDWLRPEPMSVALLGGGCALLGLGCLLFGWTRGKRRASNWSSLTALVVAGLAVGAAVAGWPQMVWWPVLAVAGTWGVLRILGSSVASRAAVGALAVLSRPMGSAPILLIGGAGLVAWQAWFLEDQGDFAKDLAASIDTELEERKVDLEEVTSQWAVTDAGRTVPLFVAGPVMRDRPPIDDEKVIARTYGLTLRTIRIKAPSEDTNCHGWVFTGGRFWVRGEWVETILRDNRYKPVAKPFLDDLAIFRDETGVVKHTGVVRGLTAGGKPLIEGKWGQLGQYVHTVDDHVYSGTAATFYHTSRGGHLLRGLGGPESAPPNGAPLGAGG